MPTYAWILIVVGIIFAWMVWSKYGALYQTISGNPTAVHAGLAVNRYATDIMGLIGAYDSQNNTDGSFMSRMGAFMGALPT